ncbi:transglutaminase family protein [Rubripirellula reticaptiva]|uniref:Transglutaminase-like superfamily protein n=1 Tax=Rubripirellula reticaptiva TaxID=2528013 RepID=A0A5C6ED95_9BACT|nr:transglutaminase family protein [Rubripirellula reticaptiva]TWU46992.1 Transglutaminase-like superfamily protein [Rubripirellula reticaptiva]
MIFQIHHRITYRYDRPVIIEPLTIRLQPRGDGSQRLLDWNCTLTPTPLASTSILDVFGNSALQASFSGVYLEFCIEVNSRVETLRTNPFDFLSLDARTTNLPARYHEPVEQALAAHLHRNKADSQISEWAKEVSASAGNQTQSFLLQVTEQIARDFNSENRYGGSPLSPSETFASKRGACRDLAVLFMDVCRSQGIAARFVSGYIYEPNRVGTSELHAWAEVYLPGGGWRGYDPSRGVAVSDQHIAVAAGPEAEWAAATEGCYIGTGAESTIEYEVTVTEVDRHL